MASRCGVETGETGGAEEGELIESWFFVTTGRIGNSSAR
jgi:hypothetical protein